MYRYSVLFEFKDGDDGDGWRRASMSISEAGILPK